MSERRKHLEFLRKTAKDAIWSGDYERALTLYEDGLALARSWKDRELEDLFTCNRATTLLEMDRQDFDLSRLKEIVLRSPGSSNAVLAAYASAHAHEVRGEYAQGRASTRRARSQKSRELGLEEWTGGVAEPARQPRAPREPLRRRRAASSRKRSTGYESEGEGQSREAAVVADNLGYCHIALDAVADRAAARAALALAAREPRRAAGDGLSVPRSLLRLAQARARRTRPRAGACARSGSARSSAATTS